MHTTIAHTDPFDSGHAGTRLMRAESVIRGLGIVQIVYGLLPMYFLVEGLVPGDRLVTATLSAVGVVLIGHGIGTIAAARKLFSDESTLLVEVALDGLLVLIALVLLLSEWRHLTTATGLVILAALVVFAASALITALTRVWV
ncbi:hypothetical protein GPX89_07960 [Nocardia sp. ET3-3]|uniref:Uncharacterized protein n=1 Tax=Nocardia terrae TaxID=2675851 RepID=A0A7K1USC7_9NOCA|nr:hypothetical protein [Nocardia terrae]MVU77181.1 hypothetical protein [Nocardia terrae]